MTNPADHTDDPPVDPSAEPAASAEAEASAPDAPAEGLPSGDGAEQATGDGAESESELEHEPLFSPALISEFMVENTAVETTIDHYTTLDQVGDKKSMNKMARRLGKEQPALLQYAARFQQEHGETIGEAAVFYCTLIWSIFDTAFGRKTQRLTDENIEAAAEIVEEERGKIEDLAERPVHRRYAPALVERQPFIYAKLVELIAEDVREEAITVECAELVFPPAQIMIEAFDAVVSGRRPGLRVGPIVRETPKVGRNEPCPCGSGKKYKKCHGRN